MLPLPAASGIRSRVETRSSRRCDHAPVSLQFSVAPTAAGSVGEGPSGGSVGCGVWVADAADPPAALAEADALAPPAVADTEGDTDGELDCDGDSDGETNGETDDDSDGVSAADGEADELGSSAPKLGDALVDGLLLPLTLGETLALALPLTLRLRVLVEVTLPLTDGETDAEADVLADNNPETAALDVEVGVGVLDGVTDASGATSSLSERKPGYEERSPTMRRLPVTDTTTGVPGKIRGVA